jgi:hypothetical protein
MEVERFKHQQLAPTVGPSSRSSREFGGPSSAKSIYSTTRRSSNSQLAVATESISFWSTREKVPSSFYIQSSVRNQDSFFFPFRISSHQPPNCPCSGRSSHLAVVQAVSVWDSSPSQSRVAVFVFCAESFLHATAGGLQIFACCTLEDVRGCNYIGSRLH